MICRNCLRVSVLMTVYNGKKFLHRSVESVLAQTLPDFEFLIIDDGSTDSTPRILESFAKVDGRLRVVRQSNIGLTRSLNKGLALAKGEYIARMDADDVSMPHRLASQVEFLDAHPEIGVLGSGAVVIDEDDRPLWEGRGIADQVLLRWRLLFGNMLPHSSVMFRKQVVMEVGGYPEDCRIAQDFDLWSRLAFVTNIYQLPEVLVHYRQNRQAISFLQNSGQAQTTVRVVQRNVNELFNAEVSGDLAMALCDSENVRGLPLASGQVLQEAVQAWGRYGEEFIAKYCFDMVSAAATRASISADIARKIVALARANAFFFPWQAVQALLAALQHDRSICFRIAFWHAVAKGVLGRQAFTLVKRVVTSLRHLIGRKAGVAS